MMIVAPVLVLSLVSVAKSDNITIGDGITLAIDDEYSCNATDTTCKIRVDVSCGACDGTGGVTYNCPTTADCVVCEIECAAGLSCQYSTIESYECDTLIVSAGGIGSLQRATINASNSGIVNIDIPSSETVEAASMTVDASSVTDTLTVVCDGDCSGAQIYCPQSSLSANPGCLVDCTGDNSVCKEMTIYTTFGTPQDVKLDCSSDSSDVCETSSIECDLGSEASLACAMEHIAGNWDCIGNCSIPTMAPTTPTSSPTDPSEMPSVQPSIMPSLQPSQVPTIATVEPTQNPTSNSSFPSTSQAPIVTSTGPADPSDADDPDDPDDPNDPDNPQDPHDPDGGDSQKGGEDDTGTIVGSIFGALVFLAIAGIIVVYWIRESRRRRSKDGETKMQQSNQNSQQLEAQNLKSNSRVSRGDKDDDDDIFDAPDPNAPATPGLTAGAVGGTAGGAGGDAGSEPVGAPLNGTAAQETQGEDDNVVVAEVVAIALVQDHVEGPTGAGPTPTNQENAPATNQMTTGGDTTTPGEPIQRGNTDVEDIFDNPNEDAEKPAATNDQATDAEKPDEAQKPADTESAHAEP